MPGEFFEQLSRASSPALRKRLTRAEATRWLTAAREAHPDLQLDEARFARHLAPHLASEAFDDPKAWLPADLFLALACLDGQPRALAHLDRWLRQGKRDEEAVQRAREKLLVGPSPRLAQYAGRAALKAWVGLVVKRVAIDVVREEAPDSPPTLAGLINATAELQLVEKDAARKVTVALKGALSQLDERDRDLLRRHYLEGETHAELAKAMKTPRSTVALWIEKARVRLLEQTRRGLKGATRLDSQGLDSLLGVVENNLDLSFSELKRD